MYETSRYLRLWKLTKPQVQSPRLVTSYAVPPQTFFTSSPFSTYRKSRKGDPACRFTYVSACDNSRGGKAQVLAFEEAVQKPGSSSTRKHTFDLTEATNTVFSIHAIPDKEANDSTATSFQVLVIGKDGFVQSLSEDLSKVNWTANLHGLASSHDRNSLEKGFHVEFVSFTDAQAAQKGLLKNREDVLAALDLIGPGHGDSKASTHLLVIITSPSSEALQRARGHTVHILAIPSRAPDTISSILPSLRYLSRHDLPNLVNENATKTSLGFALHSSSGHIYQLLPNRIITYDLTEMIPKVASSLVSTETTFKSFARISSSLILTSSTTSCTLYDVKYNSVQAVVAVNSTEEATKSHKRKESGSVASSTDLEYITYFADLGLVVGLSHHELVGQNISAGESVSKRNGHAKPRSSLLIDSIGRGVKSEHPKCVERCARIFAPFDGIVASPDAEWEQNWAPVAAQLDSYVLQDDVHGFERVFAQNIGASLVVAENTTLESQGAKDSAKSNLNGHKTQNSEKLVNGETDHKNEESIPDWQFSASDSVKDEHRPDHRRKAIYALSKLFAWAPIISDDPNGETSVPSIRLAFYTPNVLKWLIKTGFLTAELLEVALRPLAGVGNSLKSIPPRDIILACVDFDSSLRLLYVLLQEHPFLECSQIVQATKVLIKSLDNHTYMASDVELDESPRKLLNGPSANEQPISTDREQDKVTSGIEAASDDLDLALTTLEVGLSVRSLCLRTAFSRLNSFPSQRTSEALREQLTRHEIVFLIQLLRIELAEGGWTSRYIDVGPRSQFSEGGDVGDPSDRGLLIISNLLSSALDAIGAGGWLAAGAADPSDESDEMLLSLRAEISAALEGIHEASFMKGVLNDFLRYANAVSKQKPRRDGHSTNRARNKPITVQHEDDPVKRALPLGFKVEASVGATKVSSGGELRRKSAREIGNEISRRVGRYTLERIVV